VSTPGLPTLQFISTDTVCFWVFGFIPKEHILLVTI